MIEPENFIGEPFNFGECEEYVIDANIESKVFDEGQTTQITIRKRGNWVNMHVAGFINFPKVVDEKRSGDIKIKFDYPEDWPEKTNSETQPRRLRFFSCLCRVYNENMRQCTFVPGIVEQMVEGYLTINPANYSLVLRDGAIQRTESVKFKTYPDHQLAIGFTTFDMTFKLNDGHTYGDV